MQDIENTVYEINAEPKKWLDIALKLEDAAKTLQQNNLYEIHDIERRSQEYMLWGFCIENLFKGILVSKGINEIIKIRNGKSEYSGPGHDLVKLAQKVGFHLNIQDELLLKFLTNAILYFGRYPIPKNSSRLSVYWEESYDKSIEKIIEQLKSKY